MTLSGISNVIELTRAYLKRAITNAIPFKKSLFFFSITFIKVMDKTDLKIKLQNEIIFFVLSCKVFFKKKSSVEPSRQNSQYFLLFSWQCILSIIILCYLCCLITKYYELIDFFWIIFFQNELIKTAKYLKMSSI